MVIVGCLLFPQIKRTALKQIYPIKFASIVEKEAKAYGISTSLVLAVIKTESGFDQNATSPVGAKGLMQMTDETFAWMQMEVDGEEAYSAENLYQPEISIKYGCALLKKLIDYYESVDLALCAYNAGMGNVSQWIERYGDDTLSNIPFPETESYVIKVHKALDIYQEIYPDSAEIPA